MRLALPGSTDFVCVSSSLAEKPVPRAIICLCRPLGTRFVAPLLFRSFEKSSGSSALGSVNKQVSPGRMALRGSETALLPLGDSKADDPKATVAPLPVELVPNPEVTFATGIDARDQKPSTPLDADESVDEPTQQATLAEKGRRYLMLSVMQKTQRMGWSSIGRVGRSIGRHGGNDPDVYGSTMCLSS
jgi:hypothetical protein